MRNTVEVKIQSRYYWKCSMESQRWDSGPLMGRTGLSGHSLQNMREGLEEVRKFSGTEKVKS